MIRIITEILQMCWVGCLVNVSNIDIRPVAGEESDKKISVITHE